MTESSALAIARAHVQAWRAKDWDKARSLLAPDVHVVAICLGYAALAQLCIEHVRQPMGNNARRTVHHLKVQVRLLAVPGAADVADQLSDFGPAVPPAP